MLLLFYILCPIAILLALCIAIIGEILYIPFIPAILILYKRNSKFSHFWRYDLNMQDADHKVYVSDFIIAGALPGLYVAINLFAALFGIGIPFHNGH